MRSAHYNVDLFGVFPGFRVQGLRAWILGAYRENSRLTVGLGIHVCTPSNVKKPNVNVTVQKGGGSSNCLKYGF